MNILLTGATGFIGRRLAALLLARGHTVVGTSRSPPRDPGALRWLRLDFAAATRPQAWDAALEGIDVVVNTAGLFAERGAASFAAVHRDAPVALFTACAQRGGVRVVQLSALAAPAAADVPFIASKHAADAALLALPLDAVVVRPSLVFGPDGASSRLLMALASPPCIVLPQLHGGGVQPLHVDDLVQALVALIERGAPPGPRCVALVGPQPLALADYLQALRAALGRDRALRLGVPRGLAAFAARLGDRLHLPWWTTDSLRLLEAGSQADPAPTAALLGRAPRAPSAFVDAGEREALRAQATLGWALPLLRLALAFVWIATAAVSFGLYPVDASRAMLAQVGVPSAWQPLLLYGAAAFDAVLGVLTLVAPSRALWRTQIALMLFYMAVIAWRLPEQWLHPFGPLTKNVPMLAALVLLDAAQPRRRS